MELGPPKIKKSKFGEPEESYEEQILCTSILKENYPAFLEKVVKANPAEIIDLDFDSLTVDRVMSCAYADLRLIIQWTKNLPDFNQIDVEDRISLMKGTFMELSVFKLAFTSRDLTDEGRIRLSTTITTTKEQLSGFGFGDVLVEHTLKFAQKIRDMGMTEEEFAIVMAIILCYDRSNGIQNRTFVKELQSRFLDCLRIYDKLTFPEDSSRCGNILCTLSALRVLSVKAAERFLRMVLLEHSIRLDPVVSAFLTHVPAGGSTTINADNSSNKSSDESSSNNDTDMTTGDIVSVEGGMPPSLSSPEGISSDSYSQDSPSQISDASR